MGASRKQFTPFSLDNSWALEFPTEPAGVLHLGAGKIRFDARFSERHRGQDGWFSVVECELRVDGRPRRLLAGRQYVFLSMVALSAHRSVAEEAGSLATKRTAGMAQGSGAATSHR